MSGEDPDPLRQFCTETLEYHPRTEAGERVRGVVRLLTKFARYEERKRPWLRGQPILDRLTMALVISLANFSPEKGVKFATYALATFRFVCRDPRWKGHLIHVPCHLMEHLFAVIESRQRLRRKLGRSPTLAELADAAGMDTGTCARVIKAIHATRPWSPLSWDRREIDGTEPVAPENGIGHLIQSDDDRMVQRAVLSLPEREAQVVVARFGLFDTEPMTLGQVGRLLGVSGERARQLQKQGMKRLRDSIILIALTRRS